MTQTDRRKICRLVDAEGSSRSSSFSFIRKASAMTCRVMPPASAAHPYGRNCQIEEGDCCERMRRCGN